jgi:alanine dehydrogenase
MDFGVVRETAPQERRVALTPAGARALVEAGHAVHVEEGAGAGAGATDTEYLAAGAQLWDSAWAVAQRAQVLVKVHAPLPEERALLQPGITLVGMLSLSGMDAEGHATLMRERITTIACELIRDERGEHPVLEPMSALGGRMAMTVAAWHLAAPHGPGVLLGGAPGVPPAMVLVIGGGTAGQAAAVEAANMGAQVVVLDKDPRQLYRMASTVGRVAVTAIASEYHLVRYLEQADVVVGAVALRGARAPRVMERRHVRMMREGALFLDMSIDEGGCCETSRPTTPEDPVYEEEGVRHICIPNLPSMVARTSSRLLGNALLPYLLALGEGVDHALATDVGLRAACGYHAGALVSRGLVPFSSAPWVDLDLRVPPRGAARA